jgi:hypothetical protein
VLPTDCQKMKCVANISPFLVSRVSVSLSLSLFLSLSPTFPVLTDCHKMKCEANISVSVSFFLSLSPRTDRLPEDAVRGE